MPQRARYFILAFAVVALFAVARNDLSEMRALTADKSFFTSQLADVTKIEKEILQFRADASAFVLGHGDVTKSDVLLSFEGVWWRLNTRWTKYINPEIDAVRSYSRDMQKFWAALQTIAADVAALQPGDVERLGRIDAVMQRFQPAMTTMNADAYNEMIQRSAGIAQMQQAVTRSIDSFQWFFMIACFAGFFVLLLQLRRSEKLYADLQKREAEIRVLATTDPLTGLNNRRHFDEQMRAIDECTCPRQVQLLLIDLDGFKQVNDLYGHEAGDQVLCEVGARIRTAAGDGAVVARLGGDEFAIVFSGQVDQAREIASTIIAAVQSPVMYAANALRVGVSIGISGSQPGNRQSVNLLREADSALYQAKNTGRNRYVVFACSPAAQQRCKSAA